MSRYLLDTNIISNVTRPVPSQSLVAWMAERAGLPQPLVSHHLRILRDRGLARSQRRGAFVFY